MTIYQIDEFVICEYAAWDGDFTPPTSEWSPDARQLSPTNGLIKLPLYIRPGIGIVLPSPENASFTLCVFSRVTLGVVISSPEDAILLLPTQLQHNLDIVLPSLENAILQLQSSSFPSLGFVIPSPENAILQLQLCVKANSDIVIPSPESAVLQLCVLPLHSMSVVTLSPETGLLLLPCMVSINKGIILSSSENAVLQLQIFTQTNLDVVIPSSETAVSQLQSSSSLTTDISIPSPEDVEFILLAITESNTGIVIPSPEDAILALPFVPAPTFSIVNYNIRYDELLRDRIYCTSVNPRITFNIEVLALLLLEDFLNKYFIDIAEVLRVSGTCEARLGLILREFLIIQDSHRVRWDGTKTINDSFFIYEDIKLQFIQTINDALSLTDSPSAMLELLLSEFITFTETTLPNWNTARTVNESVALTDSVVQALQLFITESLTLTDEQVVQLQLFLAEVVSLSESITPNWNTIRTVNDNLTVTDILYQQLTLILTEALICTDSTPLCQLGLAIYEYLGFTELLSSPGRFSVDTADTLDAVDSLTFGYAQVISDVFSLVDTTDTIRLLLNTVAESLGLSESIAAPLNSVLPIAESLTLADTVTSQGLLYNVVHDTLLLNVVVELDGEVWECYVLNTPKFLPSIYSGFNFNSYCVFQNRAYGCKADGIYELTGDTDNGTVINTGVQLSETKFGLPNQKRFRKAYIGVSGTTPLLTMETETGETKTYSIDTDGEVDASRSLRSKKWKLTVTDFESLDFIKLVPVVLAK